MICEPSCVVPSLHWTRGSEAQTRSTACRCSRCRRARWRNQCASVRAPAMPRSAIRRGLHVAPAARRQVEELMVTRATAPRLPSTSARASVGAATRRCGSAAASSPTAAVSRDRGARRSRRARDAGGADREQLGVHLVGWSCARLSRRLVGSLGPVITQGPALFDERRAAGGRLEIMVRERQPAICAGTEVALITPPCSAASATRRANLVVGSSERGTPRGSFLEIRRRRWEHEADDGRR